MKNVEIYTDGACTGNPGKGGFGAVLIYNGNEKQISQGYRKTTNNRMELLAVIVGLEAIKRERAQVNVYSDSSYVVNAITQGWLDKWLVKGLHKQKNADLWERFYKIFKKHNVRFFWIKGHAGHPENERCDKLAVEAATSAHLLKDEGYECNIE